MISLEYLAFEVTRRCNELCKMCMRGDAENLDMSKEMIDKVLLNNCIMDIETMAFTGGEPTLNESLVCYAIELVMKHHIIVNHISIITNAKTFPKDILEACNDYQKYCKYNYRDITISISFSDDVFHEKNIEVIKAYQEKYPQFQYYFKKLDFIWKTGRAEYGEKFVYKILPVYVQIVMGYIWVMNTLYVTAKGNYETMGDGTYKDMDKLHMGSVFDNSLIDLLERYGKIYSGSEEEFKRMLNLARQTQNKV